MTRALYAGSFDPFTNGHLSILTQACDLFGEVLVAVGVHPVKVGTLPIDLRQTSIERVIERSSLDARVVRFDGLVVEACRKHRATALVRGVRDGTDLDYELQMVGMNGAMAPAIRTVLLPPEPATRHITGTLVRQIHAMGGDIASFVPPETLAALRNGAK